jgi:hypothetical protein
MWIRGGGGGQKGMAKQIGDLNNFTKTLENKLLCR